MKKLYMFLSVLLCVTMIFSMSSFALATEGQAIIGNNSSAEDGAIIEEVICSCGVAEGEAHLEGCGLYVVLEEPGNELDEEAEEPVCTCEAAEGEAHLEGCALYVVQEEAGVTEEIVDMTACSCSETVLEYMELHADDCNLKLYVKSLFEGKSANEIYAEWKTYTEEIQNYILEMLEVYDAAVYEEFINLYNSRMNTGRVEMEDGTVITVDGIPEGAWLVVTVPDTEKTETVDAIAENLFEYGMASAKGTVVSRTYDIKIMVGEEEWQPAEGDSVDIKIEVPGFKVDYRTYLQGLHILDTADAINSAIESGQAMILNEDGLSDIFPSETEASLAAGLSEDTIVYTIMLPEMGDMHVEDSSVVIDATSFSTHNVILLNVDNSEYMGEVEETGLKMDKVASVDASTGEGYVELSSYVKGSVSNTPVDVVMVIDHSGSMWTAVEPSNPLTFNDLDKTKGKREGYYVAFKKNATNSTNTACLIRYSGNTWQRSKYVNANVYEDGSFVGFINTVYGETRNWVNITDAEKESHIFAVSISGALYDALNIFMDEMENAEDCRVAICTFAGKELKDLSDKEKGKYAIEKSDNSHLDSARDFQGSGIFVDGELTWDGTAQTWKKNDKVDKAAYANAFEDPSTTEGQAILYDTINKINTDYGNTPTALGLLYARRLFNEGGRANAKKVAVVFTDGLPSPTMLKTRMPDNCAHEGTPKNPVKFNGSIVSDISADDRLSVSAEDEVALRQAYEYAGGLYVMQDGKEVLTNDCPYCEPARYAELITSGKNEGKYQLYYRNVSTYVDQAECLKQSNNATVYSIGPKAGRAGVDVLAEIASSDEHYFNASGSDIAKVFREIAGFIVSASQNVDDASRVTDIISDSFMLPNGADEKNIKVYTEAYAGVKSGKDTFSGTRVELQDAGINVDAATKKIEVWGFDFNGNAIGMEGTSPKGKKLIIRIPIVKEPDFLGGNDVGTNNPNSGIYNDGVLVKKFPEPKVDVKVVELNPNCKDTKIYLSQAAEIPHVMNVGKFKIGTVEYSVDGINNEYVDIKYSVIGPNGYKYEYTIPAGTKSNALPAFGDIAYKVLTVDSKYDVTYQVISKADNSNRSSGTDTGTVQVYKPYITFQDSVIDLGQTADYADNLVLNNVETDGGFGTNVVWKHGDDIATIAGLGVAPTLQYTYDIAAGAFTKDQPVKITSVISPVNTGLKHTVPAAMELLNYATFYRDECDFRNCNHKTLQLVAADGTNFVVHLNTFDLLIEKTGARDSDPYQTFIFRITGPENFSMDVVIEGNGQKKITAIPVGSSDYKVTELTDWSWRYKVDGGAEKTVDLTKSEDGVVTLGFQNICDETKWMDGSSWCRNIWENNRVTSQKHTDPVNFAPKMDVIIHEEDEQDAAPTEN